MITVKGGYCKINAGDTNIISVPLDDCENEVTSWDDWNLYAFFKLNEDDTDEEAVIQKITGTGITTDGDNAIIEFVYPDTVEQRGVKLLADIRGENISTGAAATFNKGFTVEVGKPIVQHTDATIPIYTTNPGVGSAYIVETSPLTGATLVNPSTTKGIHHEVTPAAAILALTWPLPAAADMLAGNVYSFASSYAITALTRTFAGTIRGAALTTAVADQLYSYICVSTTGDGIIRRVS